MADLITGQYSSANNTVHLNSRQTFTPTLCERPVLINRLQELLNCPSVEDQRFKKKKKSQRKVHSVHGS